MASRFYGLYILFVSDTIINLFEAVNNNKTVILQFKTVKG